MDYNLWIAFFIACLMLAISPGAGAINSMSIAMKYGLKTSLIANLGLQCGNVFNITVVGMGLGALLVKSEALFSVIKWVGVGYLIYLGIKKFREVPNLADKDESINTQSSSKLFFQSILVNITNPKSIVFLIALLPQFIVPTYSYHEQLLILGTTLILIDGTVMFGYSLVASRIAKSVQEPKNAVILNRIFGSMFVGAGTLLAFGSRS